MRQAPALVIGIASSSAQRRHLTRLLSGSSAFLIVSNAGEAREFLGVVDLLPEIPQAPPAAPEEPLRLAPGLAVDSDRRVLRWRDRETELTRLEHDVLRCLSEAPGQVWSYERLHDTVWGNQHLGRGSDMHSVVRRLRRKLSRLDAEATIATVRGVGFRLAPR